MEWAAMLQSALCLHRRIVNHDTTYDSWQAARNENGYYLLRDKVKRKLVENHQLSRGKSSKLYTHSRVYVYCILQSELVPLNEYFYLYLLGRRDETRERRAGAGSGIGPKGMSFRLDTFAGVFAFSRWEMQCPRMRPSSKPRLRRASY